MSDSQLIVLLDSSGPLHKCFHGYPNPMVREVDKKPMDVAAVYGYLEYVRKLTREIEYDVLVHVMDPDGGSAHRMALYPQYKGQRDSTHPVLCAQKALLRPILEGFGQHVIRMPGVESDDVIATLAHKYADEGHAVLIVTADKDLMQLVDDGRITVACYLDNGPGRPKTHAFFEEKDVIEKMGVAPKQVADLLALQGDSVDNIPGVDKCGPKTAVKWLQEYGTLASLMTHAHEIKGALGDNLRTALPILPLYRQLTQVLTQVNVDPVFGDAKRDPERTAWAQAIMKVPAEWPDDLTSDLRSPRPEPQASVRSGPRP